MPKQVTNYSLLLSCPSDVKEEIEIIKDIVNNFNRMYGEANNANIVLKHWSKDSFPQLGDSPQTLLNNQFILDCDAVVAVFWTRFGTPTDKYDSGTEEEIEELLKSGKQIFLYFSDCPIQPSLIDNEQHQKILAYRNKNKDRGVYCTYLNIDEFKKIFLNHLSLYFVKLLNNENATINPAGSKLVIKGVINDKISDDIIIQKKCYLKMQVMQEIKVLIIDLYKQINGIKLPGKVEENLIQHNINSIKAPVQNIMSYQKSNVGIDENNKNLIVKYAIDNNIDIEESTFFYLGKLLKYPKLVVGNLGFNQSYGLEGSEEEKNKYKLINKLHLLIDKYKQYIDYYSDLDSKYYLQLALLNMGQSFDEDVDVKIYFDKDSICIKESIPVPGDLIIEDINRKYFDKIFRPDKSIDINVYSNYPEDSSIPDISIYENTQKNNIKEYKINVGVTFCYDYFKNVEHDIIRYKQEYIKQYSNIYFPSILLFNNKPTKLHYEITSKYSSKIMKGEVDIM